MKRIQIYVPGILTWPGCAKNWSGRAVTFTHIATDWRAEKVEYFCGPIDRAFGQKERAAKLYSTLDRYREQNGFDCRVLTAHSNGADVALTMMRDNPDFPRVDVLHLVCAACEAHFCVNGLNTLLANDRVGRVVVYIAGQDAALRLARLWPARLLGYGTLSLHGPMGVIPSVLKKVEVMEAGKWLEYGHSTCWEDSQFAATMGYFVRP